MNSEGWKKILYQSLTGFVSLALAILLFFGIHRFGEIRQSLHWLTGVLTPFVYGGVMAYLLKTPCNFLEKRIVAIFPGKSKNRANMLSVVLVLLLSFLAIYFLMSMVIPELVNSIRVLVNTVPQATNQLSAWVMDLFEGNEVAQNYVSTGISSVQGKLQDWMRTDLLPAMQGMMEGFASTVGSVFGFISDAVIGIIICIYLLLGRRTFARQGKAVIYAVFSGEWADKILAEFAFIDKTFVGFFGGKILDSAIVGLICYVFCLILSFVMDFPNALLISVIIGISNVIPYFGPFIGAIPSALLILMTSPTSCLVFIIFVVILQQFDGNILGPRLLADSVGLTGFWVLFSITLFQGLFGFVGILIGVPVFAVIYDLIKKLVVKGLDKHGRQGLLREE